MNMKRTIPLSLLLLIAGNGLFVSQVHAGFWDTLKNKAANTGEAVAMVCPAAGIISLLFCIYATQDLIEEVSNYRSAKSVINNPSNNAENKSPFYEYTSMHKNNIKTIKKFLLSLLALGIPLTLGSIYAYLKLVANISK